MSDLRGRAVQYVEHWYFAREGAAVKPPHPLVAVQELGLTDGQGSGMRGSEPRSGRSQPPIRDMDPLARKVDAIMKHVGNVNPSWQMALERHCEHGSVRKAGAALAKPDDRGKITARLWREFNYGLAVVQSEMVRTGL